MKDYIKELYFNDATRINHKNIILNIEELEILNEDIVHTINENNYDLIYIKKKLHKIKNCVFNKLVSVDANKVYDHLVELIYKEFDFIKYDIYELFNDTLKKWCILCLKAPNINLNIIDWNIHKENVNELLKYGKKIDPKLFIGNADIFYRFMDNATEINIPDKFPKEICTLIKQRYTLIRGCQTKIFLLHTHMSAVIKILLNCSAVTLIKEYLNEKPNFDNNDPDNPYGYMLARNEEDAENIYNEQKESFIKLLRIKIKDSASSNTRAYITLSKIISTKTDKNLIPYIPTSNNKYERKIMKLINNENASSSK